MKLTDLHSALRCANLGQISSQITQLGAVALYSDAGPGLYQYLSVRWTLRVGTQTWYLTDDQGRTLTRQFQLWNVAYEAESISTQLMALAAGYTK